MPLLSRPLCGFKFMLFEQEVCHELMQRLSWERILRLQGRDLLIPAKEHEGDA
jgi:hypothetical protein